MAEGLVKTYTPVEIRKNPHARFLTRPVMVAAGQSISKGTLIGIKTSDGKAYPYNNAATNGTEKAVGILSVSVNSGTVADANGTGENRDVDAPLFYTGSFVKALLTGLDASAYADLNGRDVLADEFYIP